MREIIERLFPRLRDFEITSPFDQTYNCVAWAAGDTARWWWPAEPPFAYWPAAARREESIVCFVEAFATLGYEPTSSGEHEPGYERVAVFASDEAVPTHMARQLPDGTWTSKLGSIEDISHPDLNGISGGDYGRVVLFLKRVRP